MDSATGGGERESRGGDQRPRPAPARHVHPSERAAGPTREKPQSEAQSTSGVSPPCCIKSI